VSALAEPAESAVWFPSLALLSLVAGLAGCSGGWHRVDDLTPRVFPVRSQVQVWRDDRFTLLHGVRLGSDAVGGVPFTQAPTCDSCRVQLPLGEVDSLRLGSKERGFIRSVGLGLAIGLAIAYAFQGVGGD
jgi:hypothetical protein